MWLICFLAFCVLYAGIQILLDMALGRDIHILAVIINALTFSVIFVLFQVSVGYYSVIPQIKYLENSDVEKPSINYTSSTVIDLPQEVDFCRLKSKIAEKWVITLSNDLNQVLKFRAKMNFSSFFKYPYGTGMAAWAKLDCDAGKIHLECFPISGFQNKKHARKMREEIEECLKRLMYV